MEKIGNLQELYNNDQLFYHCNACGDINVPGKPETYCGAVEELPVGARELYETIWSEGSGWPEYVVTLNGETGMAISIVIETTYVDKLGADYDTAISVGKRVAQQLLERLPAGEVYYGEDTDPCGDEVVVVCLGKPACDQYWEDIKAIASEFFFNEFDRQIGEALKVS